MPEIKTKYRNKMGDDPKKARKMKGLDVVLINRILSNLPNAGQGRLQSYAVSEIKDTLWSRVYRLCVRYEDSAQEFVVKQYKEPKKGSDIYGGKFQRRKDLHEKESTLLIALEDVPSLKNPKEYVKGAPKVYWFSEKDRVLVMEACDGSIEDLLKETYSGSPDIKKTKLLVRKILAKCLEAIIRTDLRLNQIRENPEMRQALARTNEDQEVMAKKIRNWLNIICSYDFYKKTGINRYRHIMRPDDTASYEEWQDKLNDFLLQLDIAKLARYVAMEMRTQTGILVKPVSHSDFRTCNLVYTVDKENETSLVDKILTDQFRVLVIDPTKAKGATPSIDVATLLLDFLTYTSQDPQVTINRFKDNMAYMGKVFEDEDLPMPYIDINFELTTAFTVSFLKCIAVAMAQELKFRKRYERITKENELLRNDKYIPARMRFIGNLLRDRRELHGIRNFLSSLDGIKSMVISQKRLRKRKQKSKKQNV